MISIQHVLIVVWAAIANAAVINFGGSGGTVSSSAFGGLPTTFPGGTISASSGNGSPSSSFGDPGGTISVSASGDFPTTFPGGPFLPAQEMDLQAPASVAPMVQVVPSAPAPLGDSPRSLPPHVRIRALIAASLEDYLQSRHPQIL